MRFTQRLQAGLREDCSLQSRPPSGASGSPGSASQPRRARGALRRHGWTRARAGPDGPATQRRACRARGKSESVPRLSCRQVRSRRRATPVGASGAEVVRHDRATASARAPRRAGSPGGAARAGAHASRPAAPCHEPPHRRCERGLQRIRQDAAERSLDRREASAPSSVPPRYSRSRARVSAT